jgi:hypothetical protein
VDQRDGGNNFADPTFLGAVLITPAIVVILSTMLGVYAQILSSFNAQEMVTALHVVGTQAVQCNMTYQDAYPIPFAILEDRSVPDSLPPAKTCPAYMA